MFAAALTGIGLALHRFEPDLLAHRLAPPTWVRVLGGVVIAVSFVFATVADRQLGFHVRSFGPFFTTGGRIALLTTGAYGVVRHPIYAAGMWFQVGAFLVTGYPAVAAACAIFTLGALWFTRQE